MEFTVNVKVELGEDAQKLVAGLLAGAIAGSAKEVKETPKAPASAEPVTAKKAVIKKAVAKKLEEVEEDEAYEDEAPAPKRVVKKAVAKKEEVEEEDEAPAPKRVIKKAVAKATPVAKKAPAKTLDPTTVEFEDFDADEQLEAIQKVVVRHTKKGKTADVRQLLSLFDVRKASELEEESYSQFYDLILRYAGGEDVEDIMEEFAE